MSEQSENLKETTNVPLFPLTMPLMPGCQLPLRIFEPRYLDMVADCLKSSSPFTIVQTKGKSEPTVQSDLKIFSVGTQAAIVDFDRGIDGCLSISVVGIRRVEITHSHQLVSGLWVADNKPLGERGSPPVDELNTLKSLLEKLLQHHMVKNMSDSVDYDSSEQVMNYLIMLLPFSPHMKQALMETDHHGLRWQGLVEAIARLEASG